MPGGRATDRPHAGGAGAGHPNTTAALGTPAALLCAALFFQGPPRYEPARLIAGTLPLAAPQVVGWGQEWLEVTVDTAGTVRDLRALRSAAPFSDDLRAAVRAWRFQPARDGEKQVDARVFVAAMFRPATVYSPPGLDATDQAALRLTSLVPVPIATPSPPYPPNARGAGVVVVEVRVSPAGGVTEASVVRSAGAFDGAAADTARRWRFQPARRGGQAVPAVAYVGFSFLEPVVAAPAQPAPRR